VLVRVRPGAPNGSPRTFRVVRKPLISFQKYELKGPRRPASCIGIRQICWYPRWYFGDSIVPNGGGTNMPLSDTGVRGARPATTPRKLSDGGGLFLLITPNGSKLWRLAYRCGSKQKTLALGIYPTVSLAQARDGRERAKKLLASGVDPSVQRKTQRQLEKTAAGNSFRIIAEEVIAKLEREGRAHVTIAKKRWLLDFAYPAFGDRPVAEITAKELLALLREIEGRGIYETAKRLRSTCGIEKETNSHAVAQNAKAA
jgi:hypothetical protein